MWRPCRRGLRSAGLTLVVLTGIVGTACRSNAQPNQSMNTAEQVRIGDVLWYVDYDAALEIARQQDKALWVHFGENPG